MYMYVFQIGQIESCVLNTRKHLLELKVRERDTHTDTDTHINIQWYGIADDSTDLFISFRFFYFSQSVFMRLNLFATAQCQVEGTHETRACKRTSERAHAIIFIKDTHTQMYLIHRVHTERASNLFIQHMLFVMLDDVKYMKRKYRNRRRRRQNNKRVKKKTLPIRKTKKRKKRHTNQCKVKIQIIRNQHKQKRTLYGVCMCVLCIISCMLCTRLSLHFLLCSPLYMLVYDTYTAHK